MFRKFFAKLMGLESMPKPETAEEKFRRREAEEKVLAEERRQANLGRKVERAGKENDAKNKNGEEDRKYWYNKK